MYMIHTHTHVSCIHAFQQEASLILFKFLMECASHVLHNSPSGRDLDFY